MSMKYYKALALFFSALSILGISTLTFAAGEVVVASTTLTGAIAKAAGAQEVRVLTPANVSHPPEYDLRPSDLLKLEKAQVVVYAGYEKMASRLAASAAGKNVLTVQVDTTLSPESLVLQVRKVAAALKSEKEAGAWEAEFLRRVALLRARLQPVSGKRAVVHLHAKPFAEWSGVAVVQVVPPGELSPRVISDAIQKKPEIVIDILHSPVARVIAENAGCAYVQLINFPGIGKTATLEDLFEYNTNRLLGAAVSHKQ